jgi:glycine dehydrogenase
VTKATSNICTAQVLLAVMASMYAVYHGSEGIKKIAQNVHQLTVILAEGLKRLGYGIGSELFFDTVRVELGSRSQSEILEAAQSHGINLRPLEANAVGVTLDETTTLQDLQNLLEIFSGVGAQGLAPLPFTLEELTSEVESDFDASFARKSSYLTNPVFNRYHSETELLRYLHRLQAKDLSLTTSMIPLGSCTMKLNATAEMIPVTWGSLARFILLLLCPKQAAIRCCFSS